MLSKAQRNISPLGPGSKKCKLNQFLWMTVLPAVVVFMDFMDVLAAQNVSRVWKQHVSSELIVNKAGFMLLCRARFCDRVRLRDKSLSLYEAISTKTHRGNSLTCIRCLDFIDNVVNKWEVSYATFELAANTVIRFYASVEKRIPPTASIFEEVMTYNHNVVGAAALFIASKFRDVKVLKIEQILISTGKSVSKADVVAAEEYMLRHLENWVEIDQYKTYLAKMVRAERRDGLSTLSNVDSSAAFVERCFIKCFGTNIPGIIKAAAIALVSDCVDYIYEQNSGFVASAAMTRRWNALLYVLLVGDFLIEAKETFAKPPIVSFIMSKIFDFMDAELESFSIRNNLLIAVKRAENVILRQVEIKWTNAAQTKKLISN